MSSTVTPMTIATAAGPATAMAGCTIPAPPAASRQLGYDINQAAKDDTIKHRPTIFIGPSITGRKCEGNDERATQGEWQPDKPEEAHFDLGRSRGSVSREAQRGGELPHLSCPAPRKNRARMSATVCVVGRRKSLSGSGQSVGAEARRLRHYPAAVLPASRPAPRCGRAGCPS